MRQLHWFRTDLRVTDNIALSSSHGCEQLLCVYLMPRPRPWCNISGIGEQRQRFLMESLHDLITELSRLGQALLVLEGSPELVLPGLVDEYGIDRISCAATPGSYERDSTDYLQSKLPGKLKLFPGNTLFEEQELPFPLTELPLVFSDFRRAVDDDFAPPRAALDSLPPPPHGVAPNISEVAVSANPALPLQGGRQAALRRLHQFLFGTGDILRYKATRNTLNGLDGSSTLSSWLANGGLSVREVVAAVREFEQQYGENEGTQWLVFELLWREFFHWRAYRDGKHLFTAGGIKRKLKNCTFDPRSFARWCAGDTDYPLVNACMRQLLATGWMSNRGRQIAASCLINELGIDWRFGAAFFEKHLIDYDVASNYGNWQYIAGVGCDPRGGRHFNLEKQAGEHDPEGEFTTKWGGFRPKQPQYVTDAADWPLDPTTL